MPTILTPEFLKPYVSATKKRHKAYKETCEIANELLIHADGILGSKLIEERRPAENEDILKYRKIIEIAVTEPVFSKVVTALGKIRRSSDWSIKYDKDAIPSSIIPEETPEQYCEFNYPSYNSITKWSFDVLLKSYLADSNSVILTLSDKDIESATDKAAYRKPFSIIFPSDRVYDFVEGKYAILYSTDKNEYLTSDGKTINYEGEVYYCCDDQIIQRWIQINDAKDFSLDYEIEHKLGRMPAFKTAGVFYKAMDKIYINKSRVNAMVPHLKETVREYSDMQAEVVQHMHSQMWTYETQKCIKCKGTGKITTKTVPIPCTACSGGIVTSTPYAPIVMQLPKVGESPIPGGIPRGYVTKDTNIVKIQDERIDKHKYEALSSINMEFLSETPLSQSGDAKNVDRDELNTFVDSIAEDMVSMMDKIYADVIDLRYYEAVTDAKQRKLLRPSIPVPQNYDLLSSNFLLEELQKAKSAKLNPITIIAMEIEYANKKFNNDPIVRNELQASLELDPLPGLNDDEKLLRLQNNGITEEDYIISCNMIKFIRDAVEANKEFFKLDAKGKKDILSKAAKVVMDANSKRAEVMAAIAVPQKLPAAGGGVE